MHPQALASHPTLSVLMDAHAAFVQPAAAGTGSAPASATNVFAAMVQHYATAPDGLQQVQALIQNDSNFAAADEAAASKREDECDMLSNYYTAQFGKVSKAAKDCMCSDLPLLNGVAVQGNIPYTYCRMLLANDLHTDTIKNMESTVSDKRMQRIANGHPGGMNVSLGDPATNVNTTSTWQPKWMEDNKKC